MLYPLSYAPVKLIIARLLTRSLAARGGLLVLMAILPIVVAKAISLSSGESLSKSLEKPSMRVPPTTCATSALAASLSLGVNEVAALIRDLLAAAGSAALTPAVAYTSRIAVASTHASAAGAHASAARYLDIDWTSSGDHSSGPFLFQKSAAKACLRVQSRAAPPL